MNYLPSDNGEFNGHRNADIVYANATAIAKQQTNNELYKITPYIDFNEIKDFRKRYADECISSLNRPIANEQLTGNVSSVPSTSAYMSTSSMGSMRYHNIDDDNHCHNFDWRRMFH